MQHDNDAHNADLLAAAERKFQAQADAEADIETAFADVFQIGHGWRAVVRAGRSHRNLRYCTHIHDDQDDAYDCGLDLLIQFNRDLDDEARGR